MINKIHALEGLFDKLITIVVQMPASIKLINEADK